MDVRCLVAVTSVLVDSGLRQIVQRSVGVDRGRRDDHGRSGNFESIDVARGSISCDCGYRSPVRRAGANHPLPARDPKTWPHKSCPHTMSATPDGAQQEVDS
jgi:hypothetical protein